MHSPDVMLSTSEQQCCHRHLKCCQYDQCSSQFSKTELSAEDSDVYLDKETGLIGGLKELSTEDRSETLFIDCTTLEQAVAKDVALKMQELGSDMIDAPVSGGTVGARDATLSFMCGGKQAAFDRANKVLSLLGKRVVHCGQSGNGL